MGGAGVTPAFYQGQCAETFRDLSHCEASINNWSNACEIALNQGIDLYQNRLARMEAAIELQAGLRLTGQLPAALINAGVLSIGSFMSATYEVAYTRLTEHGAVLPNTLALITNFIRLAGPAPIAAANFPSIPAYPTYFIGGLQAQISFQTMSETFTHGNLPVIGKMVAF